jgi:S-formylglutathione hydrolase FrmB
MIMSHNPFHAVTSASLMTGWLPVTIQVVTAVALVVVLARRSRRWWVVTLPFVVAFGVLVAAAARWAVLDQGMASEPAPWQLWAWVVISGLTIAVAATCWRGTGWSHRHLLVFATAFSLLSTGLTVNGWIGYVPTVHAAWNQVTSGPLSDETDWATVVEMQGRPTLPTRGAVVRVDFDATASGFPHRRELVYLPPIWFATTPPPRLPAVMMIAGQFNTPEDWLRAGDAISTLDTFATAHGGNAPVAVFVDPNGSFTNDTECVNGPRGNAADHLTKDVVPQVVAKFGVSAAQANWGVVGFSSGGTCALDLAVMHPALFGRFVDIAGDLGPNAGTTSQTIDRLYGGDAEAWAAFDPATVMSRHGGYTGVEGMFVVPQSGPTDAAEGLCALGISRGITCTVLRLPGRHVWPFGSAAFSATLPWLAGALDTPGTPVVRPPRRDG